MDEKSWPIIKGGCLKTTDPQRLCLGNPSVEANLGPGGLLGFRVSLSINVPYLPRRVPSR